MSIFTHTIARLDGTPSSLAEFDGHVTLLVNVASKCGLTPQYTGLEELQKTILEKVQVVGGMTLASGAGENVTAE